MLDFYNQLKNSYLSNNNISYSVTSDWPSLHSGNIYESDSDGLGDTAEIFINNNLELNDLNNSIGNESVEHKYVAGKPYGTVTFLERNTLGVEAVNTLNGYANVNTILVYPEKFKEYIESHPDEEGNYCKILRNMFPNPPQGFSWKDWSAIRIEQRGTGDNQRYTVIEEGMLEGYVNGVYQQGGYMGVDKYESYILLVKNSYLNQNNIFLPTADWPNPHSNTDLDGNGDTATFTFLNSDNKYTSTVNNTLLTGAPSGYQTVSVHSVDHTKYYGYVTFTSKDYEQRDGLNGEMGEKSTDTTTVSDPSIKFSLFDYDGEINYNPGTTEYTTVNQRSISQFFPFKSQPYDDGKWNSAYHNISFSKGIWGETPYDKWEFKEGHSTVNKTLLNGYPVLNLEHGMLEKDTNNDGVIDTKEPVSDTSLTDEQRSLAYLFGGANGTDSSVTEYKPNNTLLQKEGTHYKYDCNYNAVDYDTTENVFRLRNYTERIDATTRGDQTENCDFLPFNYTDGIISGTDQRYYGFPYAGQSYSYNVRTDKANYWFGMRMDVDFIQGKDGKNENEEMVFKFSGDDDVWVFIDDVLVLDLGGTHGACTGTINFATGAIEQYEQQFNKEKNSYPTTLKKCFEAAGKVNDANWNSEGTTFADYTEHKLSFFYMERGSGASYCNIDFNLPTAPDKSVAVSKDVVDSNGNNLNYTDSTDYTFKITDISNNTPPTGKEANYTIGSETKSVDVNGQFTLQGGQTAYFTHLEIGTNYKIEEITEGQSYNNYLKSTSVSVDDGAQTTATSTTVTPTDVTQTVKFVNTVKNLVVTLNYYDRSVENGKPADINSTATQFSKTYVGSEFKGTIAATIIDSAVTMDSQYKIDNIVDTYGIWGTQEEALTGICGMMNYHTNQNYTATDYHTDCYGYTYGDENYSADKPEKWVTYYDENGQEITSESEAISNPKNVYSVNVWLFNEPRKYQVEAYQATSAGEIDAASVGKTSDGTTDLYVANNCSSPLNVYYNQRLGKAIDDSYIDDSTYLAKYGINGYAGDKLKTYSKIDIDESTAYYFWYWSFDEQGKTIASTDIKYNYRITNDVTLYAIYAKTPYEQGAPGLTVSKLNPDVYIDSNGVSKTRLNTIMNPYNCPDYDDKITQTSIVYVMQNDDTDLSNMTADQLEILRGGIKSILENGKSGTVTVIETTKTASGFKYDVQPADGTSTTAIKLTNKNRMQFSTTFTTSVLSGKRLLAFAAMYRDGDWIVSDNYIDYNYRIS